MAEDTKNTPPKEQVAPVAIPGDPFGSRKEAKIKESPTPKEVSDFHARSDVDSSAQAQHHSLGIKHDQASPGTHKHDGKSSRRLMEGIIITGAKGGNVALTNLINALEDALGFTDNTT